MILAPVASVYLVILALVLLTMLVVRQRGLTGAAERRTVTIAAASIAVFGLVFCALHSLTFLLWYVGDIQADTVITLPLLSNATVIWSTR